MTCWRIKPTVPLANAVEDIAERESRSVSKTLYRLIGEAIAARRGGGAPHDKLPQVFDEVEYRRRSLVVADLPEGVRQVVKQLAAADDRSLASMARLLLCDALAARGLLPGGPR